MYSPRPPGSGVKSPMSKNSKKYASFDRGIRSRFAKFGVSDGNVVKYAPNGWSPGGCEALKHHTRCDEIAL